MSRKKSQRKAIARGFAKYGWEPMFPLGHRTDVPWPTWATRVFRNNRFTAIINDNAETTTGKASKVYISPHAAGRDVFWKDLQRIKNEIFGPEVVAVQYFPRESELVNEVNVYWLFVYPKGVLPEPLVRT